MRQILKFILTLLLTFCCCGFLSAQVDTSIIIETAKNYSKYLDSVDKLDHPQNFGYVTSVADGIIKRDDIVVGGFGIYTLSNAGGDTAFRIECHDNLDINIYKTYYYKNNKLIYAIVELQDGKNNMKNLYRKEEFYNDNKIIRTIIQSDKKAGRYYDKTSFSLYADGMKFFDDFLKDNNRR
jgi:hypothetical protein